VEQYYKSATHERVALLCATASFYAHKVRAHFHTSRVFHADPLTRLQGRMELGKVERDALFERANKLVVQANKVGPTEQLPWLTRGCVALARNNTDEAAKSFQTACERMDGGTESVCPVLGVAACAATRGAHAHALTLYTRAMRRCPSNAARLGLGACHLRLGHTSRAREAFTRAVEVDPTDGAARCGLALCLAADGDVPAAVAALRAAYAGHSRPGALALLLLSEHVALGGHSSAADALAKGASDVAQGPSLRAAAALQLGRLAHGAGRPEDALKWYTAALSHATNWAAHLGLGQVHLSREEMQAAGEHLAACVTASATPVSGGIPASGVAVAAAQRALAHSLSSGGGAGGDLMETHAHAAELLRSLMALEASSVQGDAGACVELAGLLHDSQPGEALRMYDDAISIRASAGHRPHAGLLNNAGAVAASSGDAAAAERYYSQALTALGASWVADALAPGAEEPAGGVQLSGPASVVAFNLACVLSGTSQGAAQRIFTRLQRDNPGDPSALLFVARQAASRGDADGCEAAALQALAAQPDCIDAHTLLVHAALLRGDVKRAQGLADTARKGGEGAAPVPHAASDDHLMVAAANALLLDAQHIPHGGGGSSRPSSETLSRRENRLERALALYVKALTKQPRNLFAAHGCGCVLAERGRFGEATAVFSAVVEAALSAQDEALAEQATLNAGHCALGGGDPQRACRLYDQVLRKSVRLRLSPQVLTCAARALHEWKADAAAPNAATTGVDAELERLARSLQLLRQAVHLAPGDLRLRVDVAFVCQELGVRGLSRCREPAASVAAADRKVRLAESSAKHLQLALRLFKQLLSLPEGRGDAAFTAKRLNIHAAFCAEALIKALSARDAAWTEREAVAKLRSARDAEDQARAMLATGQQQEPEGAQGDGNGAVRDDRREQLAMESRKRLERAKEQWVTRDAKTGEKRRKAGGRKGRRGGEVGGEAAGDGEEEEEEEGGKSSDDGGDDVAAAPDTTTSKRRRLRRQSSADGDEPGPADAPGEDDAMDDAEENAAATRAAIEDLFASSDEEQQQGGV
jgi:RNA polymerase-associated protein CTR9